MNDCGHVSTSRAELRDQACRLRDEGLGYTLISRELDVPRTTVARWVNPRYAEVSRQSALYYKQRHVGACVDCGRPTRYNGHRGTVSERCPPCSAKILGRLKRGTGPVEQRVIELLRVRPLRFKELRDELGKSSGHMAGLLNRMIGYGLIERAARGWYRLP